MRSLDAGGFGGGAYTPRLQGIAQQRGIPQFSSSDLFGQMAQMRQQHPAFGQRWQHAPTQMPSYVPRMYGMGMGGGGMGGGIGNFGAGATADTMQPLLQALAQMLLSSGGQNGMMRYFGGQGR